MLPIGEVARRSGLSASALRYYERAGLVPRAERAGGRRVYGPEILERLTLIEVAKAAGFRLAEIRTLVAGLGRRTPPGPRWQALTARKDAELAARAVELARARRLLRALGRCACPTLSDCARALDLKRTSTRSFSRHGARRNAGTGRKLLARAR
ncbi:MAG TPA: MerR family transcriptional regulator [Myxococcota bacterium]|nr:MerR family transcriptional regulator [Myxococcota bacterium]